MKLTPQDILGQTFRKKLNGYEKIEVQQFLVLAAESLESEIVEKENLKKKLEKAQKDLQKFEKREDILRETLVSAHRFSKDIKSNSEKEGEMIIKESEMRAEEIINNAMQRQKNLKTEIKNLKFKRKEIENDLINMLNSLKELIESYHIEDETFEKVEYLSK